MSVREQVVLFPAPGETDHDRIRTLAERALLFDEVRTITRAVSSNDTITRGDHTLIVDTSGGNVTLAFDPAAELEGLWFAVNKTSPLNTLTLDPNGAELIDGVATLVLPSGAEAAIEIYCDGTECYTFGGPGGVGGFGRDNLRYAYLA